MQPGQRVICSIPAPALTGPGWPLEFRYSVLSRVPGGHDWTSAVDLFGDFTAFSEAIDVRAVATPTINLHNQHGVIVTLSPDHQTANVLFDAFGPNGPIAVPTSSLTAE